MSQTELHVRTWDARSKLFALVAEIKSLQTMATTEEDRGQLDDAGCKLATIYDELPWIFIAAAADA